MWKLYTNRPIPSEQQTNLVQFDHRVAEFGEDKQDEPEKLDCPPADASTKTGVEEYGGSPDSSDPGGDSPAFRCEVCDQNFATGRNLRRHLLRQRHKMTARLARTSKKKIRRNKSSDSDSESERSVGHFRSNSTNDLDFVEIKQEVNSDPDWDEDEHSEHQDEDSGPGQQEDDPSFEENNYEQLLPPRRKRGRQKREKAQDTIWTCGMCELKFKEQSKLTWHLESDAHKAVQEMEEYLNDPTNIIVPGDSHADSQLDQDIPVRSHSCEVCNTSYNARDKLERHKLTPMHQKNAAAVGIANNDSAKVTDAAAALPVHCEVCDQTFHRHLALLRHFKTEKHRQTAVYGIGLQ